MLHPKPLPPPPWSRPALPVWPKACPLPLLPVQYLRLEQLQNSAQDGKGERMREGREKKRQVKPRTGRQRRFWLQTDPNAMARCCPLLSKMPTSIEGHFSTTGPEIFLGAPESFIEAVFTLPQLQSLAGQDAHHLAYLTALNFAKQVSDPIARGVESERVIHWVKCG